MPVDWYHISTSHVAIGSDPFIFKRFSVARCVRRGADGWQDAWGYQQINNNEHIEWCLDHFISFLENIIFVVFDSSFGDCFLMGIHRISIKCVSRIKRTDPTPNPCENTSSLFSFLILSFENWSISSERNVRFVEFVLFTITILATSLLCFCKQILAHAHRPTSARCEPVTLWQTNT